MAALESGRLAAAAAVLCIGVQWAAPRRAAPSRSEPSRAEPSRAGGLSNSNKCYYALVEGMGVRLACLQQIESSESSLSVTITGLSSSTDACRKECSAMPPTNRLRPPALAMQHELKHAARVGTVAGMRGGADHTSRHGRCAGKSSGY